MQRGAFVTLLGGAAFAWPLAAPAEEPKTIAQIGFLDFGPAWARAARVEACAGLAVSDDRAGLEPAHGLQNHRKTAAPVEPRRL
jgi:hypothetical protein